MKDFRFKIPQNIEFGMGSLKKLPEILKENESEHVFLISDRGLEKIGVVGKIQDIIEEGGIRYTSYLDVIPNPTTDIVNEAAALYKECGATSIVALGGGSSMDVAKAVGVLANYGGSITDYEGNHKVLDPEVIMTAPAPIAAACGVDALIHAIEAYISVNASPFSDAMAEKAMELIGGNLRQFVANRKNEEAASAMMAGSNFAGISFAWARLGNVHAMSHPVSAYFHVPHGVANSILLPTVLEYNALADNGRYEVIYNYIRQGNEALNGFKPEMLVEEIKKLNADLGIPKSLSEAGVKEELIPAMAEDAMKSGNIPANPRQTTVKDIMELYRKAL